MVLDERKISEMVKDDIRHIAYVSKGQIGDIYKVTTATNHYILKTSKPSCMLEIEANMLKDLNHYNIRVPQVYDHSKKHLWMEYIEESHVSRYDQEIYAAETLSALHKVTNESRMYGYYYDTSMGPFFQKNEQTQYNWSLFLVHMRILPMAKICYDKGHLDRAILSRVETLCYKLYQRIDMSQITPSLLHGDLWSGNILFEKRGSVLIDPAIYFGDREMELAFIMMFHTFGETFFDTYKKIHALSDDFYTVKVPLYQIYPTLVHVGIYGASYVPSLDTLLKRLSL